MKVLFTTEKSLTKEIYFPSGVIQKLESLADVTYNTNATAFTSLELARQIEGMDACLTQWSCPVFTDDVLKKADQLKLIAHAAGSVADLVTDRVYERGIKVCSANTIMAQQVAEGVVTDILTGLRDIPQQAYEMQYKGIWKKRVTESRSLIGAKVGLIGLGTVGRYLLGLLRPFDVQIKVYDPYLKQNSLLEYPQVELAGLNEVLGWGDIISIHASLTQETRGLLDKSKLSLIKDNALLVNTARGAIVDEKALEAELKTGRFKAVLDVFETEPLPMESPLRSLDNVILLPHVAGITARENMSYAMVDEIRRFSQGEPLRYEIPFEKFKLMTKEH
jgi:phosphoglycerate dehydrogenase-like enzyme